MRHTLQFRRGRARAAPSVAYEQAVAPLGTRLALFVNRRQKRVRAGSFSGAPYVLGLGCRLWLSGSLASASFGGRT